MWRARSRGWRRARRRSKPITTDYKVPKDLFENGFGVASYNERASDDLPLDSRGGGSFKYLRAL